MTDKELLKAVDRIRDEFPVTGDQVQIGAELLKKSDKSVPREMICNWTEEDGDKLEELVGKHGYTGILEVLANSCVAGGEAFFKAGDTARAMKMGMMGAALATCCHVLAEILTKKGKRRGKGKKG